MGKSSTLQAILFCTSHVVRRYEARACRRHRRALLMCSNAPASSLPSMNSAT